MNKTDDLLNRVAENMKSSAEGSEKSEPSQQNTSSASVEATTKEGSIDRGANLLSAAGSKTANAAATEQAGSAEDTVQENVKTSPVQNPDSWTKDSALKEMKKLREENKASRLKYEDMVSKLKTEMESRLASKEGEQQTLMEAKAELDDIKAKSADKKRTLEEKLSHRDTLIAEIRVKMEQQQKEMEAELARRQERLISFESEAEAQREAYRSQLEAEVSNIPAKYKPVVDLIKKGAGEDPREALLAVREAKLLGTFEEKKVHVVNNTPGASDGARSNKDKLDENAKTERKSMDSGQKIGQALKAIKDGVSNSAFRTR
jgi:hypothetical protein